VFLYEGPKKPPPTLSVVLKSSLKDSRKYPGSNAFGASRTITADTFDELSIGFADDSPAPARSVDAAIPMEADRAKSIEKNLRFVISGRLADSHVYRDSAFHAATITVPLDLTTHKSYLLVKVEAVEVVDLRNGTVVKSFGPSR
jgi:hypothetical protein